MQNIKWKILLIGVGVLFCLPGLSLASLSFSYMQDEGGGTEYIFSGTEAFWGVLSYDDCGSSTGLARTGCPEGFMFSITDSSQITKIPVSNLIHDMPNFCVDGKCKLEFILGGDAAYSAAENKQLRQLLKDSSSAQVLLPLTDIVLGPYQLAHFTLSASSASSLPGSGPDIYLLVLLTIVAVGLWKFINRRHLLMGET